MHRCRYYLALGAALWALPLQAKPSLLKQAIQAFDQDDWAQAQVLIDQATSSEEAQGKTWYYRGAIYEKLLRNEITSEEAPQRLEKTLAAYRQALAMTLVPSQYHSFAQINLNNLWTYYLDRGRRYYRQENFEKAIEQWQYCEQIKAEAPCVSLYTAIASHQNEQYVLARQHYTQYLTQSKVAPAEVYRALAHLTAELEKNPQKGLQIIAEALPHYPFDHDLLYEQQALYQTLEQLDILKQQLEKKKGRSQQKAATYYQLGCWYELQGQTQEALQQYKKATKLAPSQVAPIRQQGIVYYNQAAQLTKKIQEMPDEEFQEKGRELKKDITRALEQALPCLEQARRLQPRDTLILKHLQTLYIRLQKPAQAAKIRQQLYQDELGK